MDEQLPPIFVHPFHQLFELLIRVPKWLLQLFLLARGFALLALNVS